MTNTKPPTSAVLLAAITSARARMAACGLTKDGDFAACIAHDLADLGYRLARIPAKRSVK